MTDWVVYGSTPLSGSWRTEHNLAHALAAKHRVLFVDPPLSPLSPLRAATPLSALLHRRARRRGRLLEFRPVALPPLEHPGARRRSVSLVRRQIGRAANAAGLESPVVLVARWDPGLEGAAGEAARIAVVRDWVPSGAGLIGRDASALELEIDSACRAADATVAISEAIRERLAGRGHEAFVVRHGFPADLRDAYDAAQPAPAVRSLPGPRLGYVGTIDARLDFAALAALAEAHGDGSLALVGPVSPRLASAEFDALRALPNVHVLPPVGRDAVPAHLTAFDCLLLPYVEDEWGRHGSPLKLWEYFYAGPPIAGTGYAVLAEYPPPLTHFGSPPSRLADAVAAALAEPPEARATRRRHALANTWDDRAAELEAIGERVLAGPRGSQL